jgi:hypothetical protein
LNGAAPNVIHTLACDDGVFGKKGFDKRNDGHGDSPENEKKGFGQCQWRSPENGLALCLKHGMNSGWEEAEALAARLRSMKIVVILGYTLVLHRSGAMHHEISF